MYKKVSIEEELPPIGEFVICFYDSGETMVYKRYLTLLDGNAIDSTKTSWAWTMRDGIADRTPKEGKITHWLKEVEDNIPDTFDTICLTEGGNNVRFLDKNLTMILPKHVLKKLLVGYINKK